MYIKQAQSSLNTQPLTQREPFCPGKGKYGYIRYNHYCTYCGYNGHSKYECEHLKALKQRPYKSVETKSKVQLNQAILEKDKPDQSESSKTQRVRTRPSKAKHGQAKSQRMLPSNGKPNQVLDINDEGNYEQDPKTVKMNVLPSSSGVASANRPTKPKLHWVSKA